MTNPDPVNGLPLIGQKVRLTALHETDLDTLQPFFEDMAALTYYIPTTAKPLNGPQVKKMLAEWHDGVSSFLFAIRSGDQLVGLINLDGLDWPNSHAEIGIALTEPDARGKHFASEAIALMCRYAFNELGLHRIWARVIEDNSPSIKLFESLGFVAEGRMKDHVLRHGKYRDMLVFGRLSP